MHYQAHTALQQKAHQQMPAETVGLMLGSLTLSVEGGRAWIVNEVIILDLNALWTRSGIADWRAELSSSRPPESVVVGWFYADPGIDIFEPRLDIANFHDTFFPTGGLLLLINPARNSGTFFDSHDGLFTEIPASATSVERSGVPSVFLDGGALKAPDWLPIVPASTLNSHTTSGSLPDAAILGDEISFAATADNRVPAAIAQSIPASENDAPDEIFPEDQSLLSGDNSPISSPLDDPIEGVIRTNSGPLTGPISGPVTGPMTQPTNGMTRPLGTSDTAPLGKHNLTYEEDPAASLTSLA